MAECSYARCLQQRRYIKRELMKWSKDMVYIAGLERVAEELMGRRKWKLYQEVLSRSQLSVNTPSIAQNEIIDQDNRVSSQDQQQHQQSANKEKLISSPTPQLPAIKTTPPQQSTNSEANINSGEGGEGENISNPETLEENHHHDQLQHHTKENQVVTTKSEISEKLASSDDDKGCAVVASPDTDKTVVERLSPRVDETSERNDTDKLTNIIKKKGESTTSLSPDIQTKTTYPVDWKPPEKCYFCVDGKLLTVNEKGELVAESGPPAVTTADTTEQYLANRASLLDSDSDSSDSSPENEVQINQLHHSRKHQQQQHHHHHQHHYNPRQQSSAAVAATNAAVNKTVTSLLRDSLPPTSMTSFESMAARLAAVASLHGLQSGLGPFYPGLWYHQLSQVPSSANTTTSEASVAALSPQTTKESPSPSDATGEQPLDLSAKPSGGAIGTVDTKQAFRTKPRVPALPGRRTYTEDELHSALQDIISGKLGTRRAAVLYGIPRSTLRNKVYKIAMEQRREASNLHASAAVLEDLDPDDEDRDNSGEDEKDDKLLAGSLGAQTDDLMPSYASRFSASALLKGNKSGAVGGDRNSPSGGERKTPNIMDVAGMHTKISSSATPQPQTPPITPNPWFDTNVLLQSLLLTGQLGPIPGLGMPPSAAAKEGIDPAALQEAFKSFMLQQELMKEQFKGTDMLNNGKPSASSDPRILMQSLQQHQQQQHHQQQQSLNHLQNRLRKSETPETASSTDMNDAASDDPSVILKIPSYKPVAGSSGSSGKNGDGRLNSPMSSQTTPPIARSRSPHSQQHQHHLNNLPSISPPLLRSSSESDSSPPIVSSKGLSLRDVIVNSINRTFNPQSGKDTPSGSHSSNKPPPPALEPIDHYKRASISVIKNLGGTDITRFASMPNVLVNSSRNSHSHQNDPNAIGKGTRPKRGKYRNYDRDSLVEAVKAVQRGEMSVHRAGSYYGVPHSTLEYKVKERHLMRPRKREPKPQPLDGATGSSASSANSKSTSNIPGLASVSGMEKTKTSSMTGAGHIPKSSSKNQQQSPFPSTSPNGMKVPPIFDPAMAAQLQYTAPHLFWPHSAASAAAGFAGLPIDFARAQAGAVPGAFSHSAESILASQMMRFHESQQQLANRHSSGTSSTSGMNNNASNPTTPSPVNNNKPSSMPNNSKSPRDLAESLYDGAGANGSFLDGLIRQTLDRKPNDISHGALLDQLVKNTRIPNSGAGSGSEDQPRPTNNKRSASPAHYPGIDQIKRERQSPTPPVGQNDLVSDRNSLDISKDAVENLLKMRDGLSLKMDEKHQHHHLMQQHQQALLQHHHHQATSNMRHLSIEDLNGRSGSGNGSGGSSMYDKLGQIKSETEDSL